MRLFRILLMAGLCLAWTALSSHSAAAAGVQASSSIPAIEFSLKDMDGKARNLKEQRGRVVAINFWATWCGPCRVELPKLNAIHDKLKGQPFTLYSINVDNAQTVSMVKPVVKKQGFNFPVLLDTNNKVVSAYNPDGIVPYTVIIDHKGMVRHVHPGYNPGDEKLVEQEIRDLIKLAEKDKAGSKKK